MAYDLQKVAAATEGFLKLVRDADVCLRMHNEARIPIPPMLAAFVQEEEVSTQGRSIKARSEPIPIPKHPYEGLFPEGIGEDWIPVKLRDASPGSVAMALLERGPCDPATLKEGVKQFVGGSAGNAFHNVQSRLKKDGLIFQANGQLHVARPERGGIISGETIWIPPEYPAVFEVAAFRRLVIRQIIATTPGVRTMEIVRTMESTPWLKIPVNKDAVKADLRFLEEHGRAARAPDGFGWQEGEEEETPA